MPHHILSKLRIPFGFLLWYALNVVYNITNKWALENVREVVTTTTSHSSALPFTIGCLQFGIGSVYACSLWALRLRRPVPHSAELSRAACIFKVYVGKICRRISRRFKRTADNVASSTRQYAQMTSPDNASQTDKEYAPANNGQDESNVSFDSLRQTFRIAIHHTFGQLCTVISLSANSIGFAHVVKAMEPFFSAIASRIVLGQRMDIRVYLALIPVVGGVCVACAGSPEFSWLSFLAGMGSNAFFAMRAVSSKIAMEKQSTPVSSIELKTKTSELKGMSNEESTTVTIDVEHADDLERSHGHTPPKIMSPANLFASVTCISLILSIPIALVVEGNILIEMMHMSANAQEEKGNPQDSQGGIDTTTLIYIGSSGLFHYLNNEVMYLVLSNVHPITLAVGNTMKRVFIIAAGVIVFSTPVTLQTAIGSTIGICGVFVYSLMKQWYGTAGPSDSVCAAKTR